MTKRDKIHKKKKSYIDVPSIEPRNEAQQELIENVMRFNSIVSVGPAGTGKTFIACSLALMFLMEKRHSRIVITRPIVPVGASSGMLPGNLNRKMEPWLRPLVDIFKQHMSAQAYEAAIAKRSIQMLAIEYARGLTFDNTILIIDEAQNTTPREMKALLTRIGENSKVIVLGDLDQSDLREVSGLKVCCDAIEQGISTAVLHHFSSKDVVRSELCRMWADAFKQLGY